MTPSGRPRSSSASPGASSMPTCRRCCSTPPRTRVRLALATDRTATAHRVADALGELTTRTASPVARGIAGWTDRTRSGADHHAIAAAADLLADCRHLPSATRALHDAAVVAARHGDDSDARRMAKEAFAGYDALDAEQLHTRLRSELRTRSAWPCARDAHRLGRPTVGTASRLRRRRSSSSSARASRTPRSASGCTSHGAPSSRTWDGCTPSSTCRPGPSSWRRRCDIGLGSPTDDGAAAASVPSPTW